MVGKCRPCVVGWGPGKREKAEVPGIAPWLEANVPARLLSRGQVCGNLGHIDRPFDTALCSWRGNIPPLPLVHSIHHFLPP